MSPRSGAVRHLRPLDTERLISATSSTPMRSEFGRFTVHAYETVGGAELLGIVSGNLSGAKPLVRVQSACATGMVLHSHLCDCRQQLHRSLELVGECGGVVLVLDDDGRGHGLVEKVEQLALIAQGMDTVDAAASRGKIADVRRYEEAVAVLHTLIGDRAVRLLTNNPAKLKALVAAGLGVAERLPMETEPTPTNRDYLEVKKVRLGHLLTLV